MIRDLFVRRTKESKTDHLSVNLEIAKAEERLDIRIFERDETKTFAPAGLSVKHDCSVYDFAELREKLAHRFGGDAACETTDE